MSQSAELTVNASVLGFPAVWPTTFDYNDLTWTQDSLVKDAKGNAIYAEYSVAGGAVEKWIIVVNE